MFDRCLNALATILVLVFLVPVLAVKSLFESARDGVLSLRRDKSTRNVSLKNQIAGEFNFERAIEAYEELIDATLAGGRP